MKLEPSQRSLVSRLFVSLMLVAMTGIVLWIPMVNAQQEKMGVSDQVTVKVTRGGAQNSSTTQVPIETGINASVTSTEGPNIRYLPSYQKIYADSSNPITLQTDRHLYKPGDSVKVDGSIWSGLASMVGGIDTVSIQVRDNNDSVVYTGKSDLKSDGSYSTLFQIPSDVKNGWFTIEAKADVSQDVLNTLTFKLQAGLDTMTKFVTISPNAWPIRAEGQYFEVNISSNSNVTDTKFDEQAKKVSFIVTGESGTEGVADVTIPKSLLSGGFTVMVDGQPIPQSNVLEIADTQDSVTLEINYYHSQEIDIIGTNVVPEFPLSILTLNVAIISFLVLSLVVSRINEPSCSPISSKNYFRN